MATLAPCLVTLRGEFNALNPDRDKASDGWIGDPAHAAGDSDHNPDSNGVVHAIDVDETGPWPNGATMEKIVQHVIAECRKSGESGLDRGRLKYVIYERRIWEASNGWAQRAYSGANAHDKHAHFSCEYNTGYANDTRPWGIEQKWGDMDQATFNARMNGWAATAEGKTALEKAALADVVQRIAADGSDVPASDGNPKMGVNSSLYYLAKDLFGVKADADALSQDIDTLQARAASQSAQLAVISAETSQILALLTPPPTS